MNSEVDYVFELVCHRLPEVGIDYLMIGGHAVNHYGYVRATQDIDFMIAATDQELLRRTMLDAGFTNVAVHDNVIFFSRPESPLRVDFLKVDRDTLNELLANAVAIDYINGHKINVPRLEDLLAMKLFALQNGKPERQDKDFPDIVHLVIQNDLDTETLLRPLCDKFGTADIYHKLCARIRELRDA